jgi:hypothetical protein
VRDIAAGMLMARARTEEEIVAGCTPNKRAARGSRVPASRGDAHNIQRELPNRIREPEFLHNRRRVLTWVRPSGRRYYSIPPSSSSNALASVKSAVSKPSVNQP